MFHNCYKCFEGSDFSTFIYQIRQYWFKDLIDLIEKKSFLNFPFVHYTFVVMKKKYACFKFLFLCRTTTTLSLTPEESTCPQYSTPIHTMNQNSQYHGHPKSLYRRSICPRHSPPGRGPCSCSRRIWPIANDTPITTTFTKVTWILMIGSRSCRKVQMK